MQHPPRVRRVAWLAMSALLCAATNAHAASFADGSFENGFASWNLDGDTDTHDAVTFQTTPTDGTDYAVLTTAPGSAATVGSGAVPASTVIALLGMSATDLANVTPAPFAASEGSAIQQTFETLGGGNITFDWNFLSDESAAYDQFGDAYPDFAIVHIRDATDPTDPGQTFLLVDADSEFEGIGGVPVIPGFDSQTGWRSFDLAAVGMPLPGPGTYSLGIAVFDVNDNLFDSALAVDNVVVAETPEVLLLGLGLLGLVWCGRERAAPTRRASPR